MTQTAKLDQYLLISVLGFEMTARNVENLELYLE